MTYPYLYLKKAEEQLDDTTYDMMYLLDPNNEVIDYYDFFLFDGKNIAIDSINGRLRIYGMFGRNVNFDQDTHTISGEEK